MAAMTTDLQPAARTTASSPITTKQSRPPVPLTSIFTPPASCSSIVTWDGTNFWQFGTNQTGGDCYPPKFLSIFNSYYTPGICPDQWTSAGTVKHSLGFDAMCCPSGYFLSKSTGNACASLFSGLEVLSNVYSTVSAGNKPIPSDAVLTTVAANNAVATVIADVIQVQWQNKDQQILSLMSSPSSPSETGAAATTGARKTAPTSSSTFAPVTSSQNSSELSTGAKAGIGVAVSLVVLALLSIGLFLFFRRRRARDSRQDELPPEVEARSGALYKPPPENRSQTYHEPAKVQPPTEMEAQDYKELPGDRPRAEVGGKEVQQNSLVDRSIIRNG